jgi:Mn-containing catalase
MEQLKALLVEQMQDLLHAETQLTAALPKMAEAANNPSLREAFEKHLIETRGQVERLRLAFSAMGEEAKPRPCKGMKGLIEEGEETIKDNGGGDEFVADLALIAAAQKVEHYEIAGYGNAKVLARQLGLVEVAALLCQSLGEEESSDYMLTAITKPILQELSHGGLVNLHSVVSAEGNGQGKRKKATANA